MQQAGTTAAERSRQETVAREGKISTEDSTLLAYAIPTDEELLIARDTLRCILKIPHE